MGKIYSIMGKSSTGKDTIYKELLKTFPNFKEVVMYTTRPIRKGEKDGVEYYFVDENKLAHLMEEGKVIEQRAYNTVHGVWKYFTVDDGQIEIDKHNYLFVATTVPTVIALGQFYERENVVPIYLELDDGLRLERALRREQQQETPKYEELCRRFLTDSEDFSEENLREAGEIKRFNNENLTKCLKEITKYIKGNIRN
jgi:guanylate kinase